jgi:hypothetical protein
MYEKLLRFNRRKVHPLYSQNKKRREDVFGSGALQVPEKKNKQKKNSREWSGYSLIPKFDLGIKELRNQAFFCCPDILSRTFFSETYHTSRPILISTTCTSTIRSVLVVEKSYIVSVAAVAFIAAGMYGRSAP